MTLEGIFLQSWFNGCFYDDPHMPPLYSHPDLFSKKLIFTEVIDTPLLSGHTSKRVVIFAQSSQLTISAIKLRPDKKEVQSFFGH